jgi:hypothetical protein
VDVLDPGDFVLPVLLVNVKNVNKSYFKKFGIKQRHLLGIHVQFKLHILPNISLFFKNAFLQLRHLNTKKTVSVLLCDISESIFLYNNQKAINMISAR